MTHHGQVQSFTDVWFRVRVRALSSSPTADGSYPSTELSIRMSQMVRQRCDRPCSFRPARPRADALQRLLINVRLALATRARGGGQGWRFVRRVPARVRSGR